jgi:molecular chaperone DnaK
VGPQTDPVISGRIKSSDGQDFSGFTIEFTNTTMRPPWRSGRIELSPEGSFLTNLEAEKGAENIFTIEVFDAQGNRQSVSPERITYLVDVGVRPSPIINSIGVAVMGNRFVRLLEKGMPLPARKRKKFCTGVDIRRGQPAPPIVIVAEGDNSRADRNKICVEILLPVDALARDLPAGTGVDVTVEMDESRLIRAKAYIDDLDQDLEAELDWTKYQQEANSAEGLRQEFNAQTKRHEEYKRKSGEMRVEKAEKLLLRIDADRIIPEIQSLLSAASDHDAAVTCRNRILDLARALDRVEDVLEWPGNVARANEDLSYWKKIIEDDYFKASTMEKSEFYRLEGEIRQLLEKDATSDADKLRDLQTALDDLGYSILLRSPAYWDSRFKNLEKRVNEMTNQQQAQAFLDQGYRARQRGDFEALKSAVLQLSSLLPRGATETKGPILIERGA